MKLNEILESPFEIIDEANDSEVDGKHILARVRGVGFRVNSASRNKRYYSHELWTKAIKRNSTRMNDRMVLGYLGHGTDNSDEGIEKAAFILTKMEISPSESDKESDGIVEYLVLGTPSGTALNTMLRAGVRLGLSSRATGTSTGKDNAGNEVLSAETYNLHGFDIVQNTGVAGAIPNLIESIEGAAAPQKGDSTVSEITIKKDHYEQLVATKASLEAKLEAALASSAEKDAAREEAAKELTALQKQVDGVVESLESYVKLGTEDEVKEALEQQEAFKPIGTPKEVSDLLDTLERYVTIASVGQVETMKEASHNAEAVMFAEEHKCTEALATSLLSKMDAEEAAEILKEMPSVGKVSEAYRPMAKDLTTDEGTHERKKTSLAHSLV